MLCTTVQTTVKLSEQFTLNSTSHLSLTSGSSSSSLVRELHVGVEEGEEVARLLLPMLARHRALGGFTCDRVSHADRSTYASLISISISRSSMCSMGGRCTKAM